MDNSKYFISAGLTVIVIVIVGIVYFLVSKSLKFYDGVQASHYVIDQLDQSYIQGHLPIDSVYDFYTYQKLKRIQTLCNWNNRVGQFEGYYANQKYYEESKAIYEYTYRLNCDSLRFLIGVNTASSKEHHVFLFKIESLAEESEYLNSSTQNLEFRPSSF